MISKLQCPSCKSNNCITTNLFLCCLKCGNQEYLYDYANAYDNPMPRDPDPDIADIEDRVNTLESISAQRGGIPRQYQDQFQQIRGELANLRQKIVDQPKKTKQPVKSTYKGLEVG